MLKSGIAILYLFQKRAFLSTMPKSSRPFTVFVEGNIGCGKTTFINYFSKFPAVLSLAEPVNMWRNAKGHNLLDLLYQEPKKYAMAFQSFVQLTMLQNHIIPCTRPIKVMERSIHSARHCFVENLQNCDLLASADFAVLDQWYSWICNTQDVNADLIVYLYTTPETAMQRIQKRSRKEEKMVPLSYLTSLHELHEKWLRSDHPKRICPVPVLEIDANKDLSELASGFSKCESAIFTRNLENLIKEDEKNIIVARKC